MPSKKARNDAPLWGAQSKPRPLGGDSTVVYFDQVAKKRVVESFYRSLREGGYLLLGHSESLLNTTTAFSLKHLKTDMVYQKPHSVTVKGGCI